MLRASSTYARSSENRSLLPSAMATPEETTTLSTAANRTIRRACSSRTRRSLLTPRPRRRRGRALAASTPGEPDQIRAPAARGGGAGAARKVGGLDVALLRRRPGARAARVVEPVQQEDLLHPDRPREA